MRGDMARQLGLGVLDIGAVEREPDRAAVAAGSSAISSRRRDPPMTTWRRSLRGSPGAAARARATVCLRPLAEASSRPSAEHGLARRVERGGIGRVAVDERHVRGRAATPAPGSRRASARSPAPARAAPRRAASARRAAESSLTQSTDVAVRGAAPLEAHKPCPPAWRRWLGKPRGPRWRNGLDARRRRVRAAIGRV